MGGYNAGEVASNMATSFVRNELGRWLREASTQASDADVRRAMDICVDNANRAIFNSANSNPQYAGMGTTLVVAVFRDGRLLLGHVGDSRCYRMRQGRLQQITRDHSLSQELLDAGMVTEEEMHLLPSKNLVTRALGASAEVEPEIHVHDVEEGDVLLLCSDGLTEMVGPYEMGRLLTGCLPDLTEAARRLVDMANEAGGRDNISVVLVRARAPGAAAPAS